MKKFKYFEGNGGGFGGNMDFMQLASQLMGGGMFGANGTEDDENQTRSSPFAPQNNANSPINQQKMSQDATTDGANQRPLHSNSDFQQNFNSQSTNGSQHGFNSQSTNGSQHGFNSQSTNGSQQNAVAQTQSFDNDPSHEAFPSYYSQPFQPEKNMPRKNLQPVYDAPMQPDASQSFADIEGFDRISYIDAQNKKRRIQKHLELMRNHGAIKAEIPIK